MTVKSVRWRFSTARPGSDRWGTPPDLYLALDKEFSFTVDAAADDGNAKADIYFDRELDGLAQPWTGERVFCNPPYGRGLDRWCRKAVEEARLGALVVYLLPARTGNAWFHDYVIGLAECRFIKGRLQYKGRGAGRKVAPFDSMVVIWRPGLTVPDTEQLTFEGQYNGRRP